MSEQRLQAERRRLEHAAFRARLAEAFRGRPRVVLVLVALLILCGLAVESADVWLGQGGSERFLLAAGLVPERVREGEWWRLVSGTLLHRSWSHLLLNSLGLLLIGRYVEVAFGSLRFWWIYAGSTVCGGLGTIAAGHALSVGASGAVFGLVGAMAAIGLRLWPSLSPGMRRSMALMPLAVVVGMLALGLMVDQVAGGPTIDHHAHLGGAFAGLALGWTLELQLRDADGVPLLASVPRVAPSVRWSLIGGGAALALVFASAITVAAARVREPLRLKPAGVQTFEFRGRSVGIPRDYRRGLWRLGACRGALVDGTWALRTRRILCFELPLGGVLLLGRRDQLLTLDAGDEAIMKKANRTGKLTRRQRGVLLYPWGEEHLYVVLGPDSMLDAYAAALGGVTPPSGSARVSGTSWPPGDALLPGDPRPKGAGPAGAETGGGDEAS